MSVELKEPLNNRAIPSHLPFLDGIRGIAILWVFGYHAIGSAYGWNHFPWKGLVHDFHEPNILLALFPLNFGLMGVSIFFVVSGFCIHLSHSRARTSGWLYFFHRRFFRIYPAYLVALLIFLFLWPWHHFSSLTAAKQFFIHTLSIHNLDLNSKYAINPSFWSIATEMQLYLIYPVLMLLTNSIGWNPTLILLLAIEIFLHSLNGEMSPNHGLFALVNSPLGYWFSWVIGAYLANLFLAGKTNIFAKVNFTFVLILAIFTLLFKPLFNFSFTAFAFLTAIVIDRLISQTWTLPSPSSRVFNILWRHLSFVGLISYSLYLFHQPMLNSLPKFFLSHAGIKPNETNLLIAAFSLYPLILLIAWMSFKLIETPSIVFGNKVWSKLKPA